MNAKTEESIQRALKYSENPEALTSVLQETEIDCNFLGIFPHFPADKESRLVGNITISRKGKTTSFHFGFSLHDTETYEYKQKPKSYGRYHGKWYPDLMPTIRKDYAAFLDGILYSILCTIRSEFYCEPIFEDFCSEFGFDSDSRKAFETWQACLKQSAQLRPLFSETEIESFPS